MSNNEIFGGGNLNGTTVIELTNARNEIDQLLGGQAYRLFPENGGWRFRIHSFTAEELKIPQLIDGQKPEVIRDRIKEHISNN